jgi:hypothetical protein
VLGFFVLFTTAALGISLCTGLQPKLCLQRTGVITVGETVKMQVGQRDLGGDYCRPDAKIASRLEWRAIATERSFSWQSSGPTVHVRPDGTVRGLAPGAYAVEGRHANATEREEGIVLPAGWTMRLEPENATIAIGQSVRYRVRVLGPAQAPLDGVPFSVLPAAGQDMLRMSGLATNEWVEYTAIAPGRATINGHVGDHEVTTSLTVVEAAARDQ